MDTLTVSLAGSKKGRGLDFRIIAAFFAIYVIWGSTFLAIRIAVLLVPRWLCAGIRFFTAGVILYAFSLLRGETAPTRKEWRSLAMIGMLMFSVTYGALFWAEQYVPSGITSVLDAMLPLFTVVLEVFVFRQQKFQWRVVLALLAGFCGVR
jgi:drug/metabolite transporter (DMT)-like permease